MGDASKLTVELRCSGIKRSSDYWVFPITGCSDPYLAESHPLAKDRNKERQKEADAHKEAVAKVSKALGTATIQLILKHDEQSQADAKNITCSIQCVSNSGTDSIEQKEKKIETLLLNDGVVIWERKFESPDQTRLQMVSVQLDALINASSGDQEKFVYTPTIHFQSLELLYESISHIASTIDSGRIIVSDWQKFFASWGVVNDKGPAIADSRFRDAIKTFAEDMNQPKQTIYSR